VTPAQAKRWLRAVISRTLRLVDRYPRLNVALGRRVHGLRDFDIVEARAHADVARLFLEIEAGCYGNVLDDVALVYEEINRAQVPPNPTPAQLRAAAKLAATRMGELAQTRKTQAETRLAKTDEALKVLGQ
jgi:hypothetical protein